MAYTHTVRTEIPIGDASGKKQSIIVVPAAATAHKPGVINLQAVSTGAAVANRYIYFNSAGTSLKHHTAIPTNVDTQGTAISGGAATDLSNIASVAIPDAGDLIPANDNQVDLGSATKQMKDLYINGTAHLDLAEADAANVGRTAGVGANYIKIASGGVLTTEGSSTINGITLTNVANEIKMTKGTATLDIAAGNTDLVMNAGAQLDVAAGKTVNIDMNLTVNTSNVTLNQSLSTTDNPTFGNLTVTQITDSTATMTGGALSGVTTINTTSHVTLEADNAELRMGAAAGSDSYIKFDGSTMVFYDTTCGPYTLQEIAAGTEMNPVVVGDLTISDGKFNWTDLADETAATWTFSTTTNNAINIVADSLTTVHVLDINADGVTDGWLIHLDSTAAGWGTGGYFQCYDGAAQDFAIKNHGEVEIAGADATDMITITKGHIQVDDGKIEVDADSDIGSYFKRNQATATSAILALENTDTGTGSTGTVLDINSLGTGNGRAVEIDHNGDYSALYISASAASDGDVIEIPMANRLDERAMYISGNITGAAGEGTIHIDLGTGVLAANANALLIEGSGNHAAGSRMVELNFDTGTLAGASDGFILGIYDTSGAAATSYAVEIDSTNNEALHVDAGQCLFDELTTHNGGITIADSTNLTIGAGGELVFANGGTQVDTTIATNAWRVGDGAGTNCVNFAASTGAITFSGTARPTKSIFFPASLFKTHTGTPAEALVGDGTDKAHSWAMDKAGAEAVVTALFVPDNLAASTNVTAYIYYCTSAGAGDVKWDVICDPLAEDEDIDADAEITDTVTDSLISANPWDLNVTSGITIAAGTEWAANDFVTLIIQRDGGDAGDTVDADANFLGIRLDYTADSV